ncbi:unnamed protein product [Cylindrotheca closterium]|uniref:Uncharacterized protein n=1 Tax=Cylindrotheca closterium TaxID=2856 RepID=A0AAD2FD94_9STRA|nr:unnamed protein product [Cylindrotheca closterium]
MATKDKPKRWDANPARAIILADLESGNLSLFEDQMSAEQAFHQYYKDNGEVQAVGLKEFKIRLKAHRGQVQRRKQNGPPKPPPFPWKKSEAKCILMEDLYRGVLSLERNAKKPLGKWKSYYKALESDLTEENEAEKFNSFKERLEKRAMTAAQAWEMHYKHLPAFEEVKFDQFKRNLASHRKQLKDGKKRSMEEEEMWREDRKRFPPVSKKADGSPLWYCHPAKLLLRQDVAEGKHNTMKPEQLQQTKNEYRDFSLTEFRRHIYQENRRRRFINYLNDKRENRKTIHCCKAPVDANDETLTDRLEALGLGETSEEQMDVDGDDVIYVLKGEDTRKRQVNSETNPPNKTQKLK